MKTDPTVRRAVVVIRLQPAPPVARRLEETGVIRTRNCLQPASRVVRLRVNHGLNKVRAAHALQNALRRHRRHPVAGAWHRRERRHFLALQPDAGPPAAGRAARASSSTWEHPVPSRAARRALRPAAATSVFSYPMFRDLEKAQTVVHGLAAHVIFGANLAARGQTLNGEAHARLGQLLPDTRAAAGARTAVHAGRRPDDRRAARGGAELRVLAKRVSPQRPVRDRSAAHRSTARR